MAQAAGYSFDTATVTGSTVRDLAGYFLDGTIVGSAAITTGKTGYGNALHCTGGALQVPVAAGTYPVNTDGGLTVAAWVILDTTTATARCIASGKSAGVLDWALYASNASGNVEAVIEGTTYSSSTSIRDGAWHHVMVIIDTSHGAGNDQLQIVVDGTVVLSLTSQTTGLAYSGAVTIEAGRNALSGGEPLNGILDDFRWWNDPVESASWPTVRDNQQTDLQLAIYPFDDGTGDDFGVYNRDLTLAGSSSFVTSMYGSGLRSTTAAAGASGTVAFGDVDRLAITGWMRLDTAPTGSPAPVMSIKDSGGTEKVRVVVNTDRTVTCTWVTIYGTYSVTSGSTLTVGQWSRFQFAMNPTYVSIRLDSLTPQITNTSNPVPHLTPAVLDLETLYIGGDAAGGAAVTFDYLNFTQNFVSSPSNQYWIGPVNRTPVKPANVARGIYEFNEGAGTTAHDSSSSSNDLTLTAGGSWITGVQGTALGNNGAPGAGARKASGLVWDASPKGWAAAGWVRLRASSGGARFLVLRNSSGEVAHLGYLSGLLWGRLFGAGGSTGLITSSAAPLTAETWTHVAMSCNGSTMQFYVNGVFAFSADYTVGALLSPTELNMGGDNSDGSNDAVGDMDSWALFDTPISTPNVAWLYANPGAMANLPVDVTLATAHETDTAHSVTSSKTATLGTGTETDTAYGIAATKATTLSTAEETDTAYPAVLSKDAGLATAAEVDTAYPVTANKAAGLGTANEVNTAYPVALSKTVTLETAHETDTAYVVTVTNEGAARVLSTAHETDTAYTVTATKTVTLATAHEIDRAFALIVEGAGVKWPALTVSNSQANRAEVSHGI